jgi:hypothetical protein
MLLGSLAPVGLECTLGHEKWVLLVRSTVLRQTLSINDEGRMGQRLGSVGSGAVCLAIESFLQGVVLSEAAARARTKASGPTYFLIFSAHRRGGRIRPPLPAPFFRRSESFRVSRDCKLQPQTSLAMVNANLGFVTGGRVIRHSRCVRLRHAAAVEQVGDPSTSLRMTGFPEQMTNLKRLHRARGSYLRGT